MTSGSAAPRRLLFVVNNAAFFTSHRRCLGLGARDAGYDVHVAAAPSPALDAVRRDGFVTHALPLRRSAHGPVGELATVASIYRLFRRLRPAIVHNVTLKPVLYGSVAARAARVPAVVNAVSGLGYVFLARGGRARARRAAVMLGYRAAFAHRNVRVIFQNPVDAGVFTSRGLLDAEEAVLIRGSGVDLDAFRPTPEPDGPPVVVLPARLLRDKGVHEFVDAAARLRASGVAARFALVGDTDPGNPAAIPPDQLARWRDAGVVEWWGHRADMPAVLASAHVVCLPSYREGLSKVLLEAAAAGRAVVTTDVPGCRDAVEPGRTALVVPARDAGALAGALRAVIEDAGLRDRFGRAGRALAEAEFDERAVVARTLGLYDELMSR